MLRLCPRIIALRLQVLGRTIVIKNEKYHPTACLHAYGDIATSRCDTDDTDHTSDKRGTWQCPNACVIAFGNPLNRSYEVKGGEHRRFEINWNKRAVSVDGKRCKELPQTYIYK